MNYEPQSGRGNQKVEEILEKIQEAKHIGIVDIRMELGINYKIVCVHLHKPSYKKIISLA